MAEFSYCGQTHIQTGIPIKFQNDAGIRKKCQDIFYKKKTNIEAYSIIYPKNKDEKSEK